MSQKNNTPSILIFVSRNEYQGPVTWLGWPDIRFRPQNSLVSECCFFVTPLIFCNGPKISAVCQQFLSTFSKVWSSLARTQAFPLWISDWWWIGSLWGSNGDHVPELGVEGVDWDNLVFVHFRFPLFLKSIQICIFGFQSFHVFHFNVKIWIWKYAFIFHKQLSSASTVLVVKVDLSCPKYTKEKPKNLLMIENILAYELVRRAFVVFDIFVKTDFPVPIFCLKLLQWTCYVQYVPNRSNRNSNWLKIYWRTSSYAGVWARTPCTFFTLFNLVKNDFPVLINCLNCQSGLILSKMYETDAKEPLNSSKYTGVRARTPCTFDPCNFGLLPPPPWI